MCVIDYIPRSIISLEQFYSYFPSLTPKVLYATWSNLTYLGIGTEGHPSIFRQ